MPVTRRPSRPNELTPAQHRHLATGWIGGSNGEHFRTQEQFAAAWEQHRDEFLEDWIARQPGTRPLAWWICDHGRERPLVSAMPAAEVDGLRNGHQFTHTFGFLHTRPGEFDWMQEPEAGYLRRNGLLRPGELN